MRAEVHWEYGSTVRDKRPVLLLKCVRNGDAVVSWLKDRMGLDAHLDKTLREITIYPATDRPQEGTDGRES